MDNLQTDEERISFVAWDGKWYGVPSAWVNNLERAGLVVLSTLPIDLDAEVAGSQQSDEGEDS